MTAMLTLIFTRTFLPAALKHHSVACTEERPLFKKTKDTQGYTSNMKAKVQYPALKSVKQSENKKNEVHANGVISSTKKGDLNKMK